MPDTEELNEELVDEELSLHEEIESLADEPGDLEPEGEKVTEDVISETPEIEPLAAMDHWPHEWRSQFEQFASLTGEGYSGREAQQLFLDAYKTMQSNSDRAFTESRDYRQQAETATRMHDALKPYMQNISAAGMSPDVAISQALSWYQRAVSNPQTFLAEFAQRNSVNVNELAQNQPYIDPVVAQMQQQHATENQHMADRLAAMEGQREQEQQAHLYQGAVAFESATDANGDLLHPHLGKVHDQMLNVVQQEMRAGRTPNYEHIYEHCIWTNPEVRQLMISGQTTASNESKSAKAKTAKKASKRPQGSAADGKNAKPGRSIRDEIDAVMASNEE